MSKKNDTEKTALAKGSDGFYHPSTEHEIIELIAQARESGVGIRVRGSAHSVKKAIYTDGYSPDTKMSSGINIMLDQYRSLIIDEENMTVTCNAGINLGPDPYDPSGVSTESNSLLYQLNEKGLALPDLGGITHQTVAGFLATGSSGGSLNYDLGESILSIRLIDGTGKIHVLSQDDSDTDKFYAAGVSMGLLGIVTEVTFQCEKSYHIKGMEAITTVTDAQMNLFGHNTDDKPSYMDFLLNDPQPNGDRSPYLAEYSRMLWWPQKGVNHIVNWSAYRMIESDYNAETGTEEDFKRLPYVEVGIRVTAKTIKMLPSKIAWPLLIFMETAGETLLKSFIDKVKIAMMQHDHVKVDEAVQIVLRNIDTVLTKNQLTLPFTNVQAKRLADLLTQASEELMQAGGGLFYTIIGQRNAPENNPWRQLFDKFFGDVEHFENIYPQIINKVFVPLDINKKGDNKGKPQIFWDTWWQGLPMDNQIDDLLLPTQFTEIWIPIEQTEAVMNKLNDFFQSSTFSDIGTFSYELYGTTKSKFWMSPSYARDVVRVDVFWFTYNYDSPVENFYPQFWSLLKEFDYRLHWGKFLVQNTPSVPDDYLQKQYPKWGNWMKIRQELDPDNLFLTDYWKTHLNL
jgi:hypothetical protein